MSLTNKIYAILKKNLDYKLKEESKRTFLPKLDFKKTLRTGRTGIDTRNLLQLGLLLVAVVAVSSVEHGDAGAVLAVNRGAVAPSQAFSYAQVIHNHAPSVAYFVEGGNSSPAHHGVSQSRHVAGNNAVVQTVTKEVPYPVLQPYAITIEKHIPYAVSVPVAVPVDRPYPVAVPRPYLVPFERPVPVPVNKLYPYPIKYPVEVKVPVPTPVPVAKPYHVYVYNKSYDDEPAAGDDYSASVENDHD